MLNFYFSLVFVICFGSTSGFFWLVLVVVSRWFQYCLDSSGSRFSYKFGFGLDWVVDIVYFWRVWFRLLGWVVWVGSDLFYLFKKIHQF